MRPTDNKENSDEENSLAGRVALFDKIGIIVCNKGFAKATADGEESTGQ